MENESNRSFTRVGEAVGRRLKQKYEQPLHYLTQKLLKQWDEWKPTTPANEMTSFEGMMLPYDAEAVVLGIEQVHRKFTCPEFLAKCWAHDPLYLDNV
ncbi:Protein RDM1 [Linum perenne]